jgi:hypothetical protein
VTRPWLAALAVCLAAVLPYLPSLDNYFVNDDFGVVRLLSQKPALYFPRWFVTSWMDDIWGVTLDEIRPFTAVSYQMAAAWGATSPVANHVVNIAFHAATALLVLAVARVAGRLSLAASTFAGLAFALLPLHAETVAWITGRVDSIPAAFFLGSFLAYAGWRRGGSVSTRLYISSLALFFAALFSKQNTIVMVVTLLLYDPLVEQRPIQRSSSWLAPYLPFAILTAGYLLLRYVLFGEVAREGQLTLDGLGLVRIFVGKHLQRMFFGGEIARYPFGYITAVIVAAGVWLLTRGQGTSSGRRESGQVLFFGPSWWILGLVPLVVVAYETNRHVYLAAVGWAIVLGLVFDALWRRRRPAARAATVLASVGLLAFYTIRLQAEVDDWRVRASVSQKMVADLEREVQAAPQGSLVIVGGSTRSWEWSLPFAAQRPFTRADLTERVSMVSPVLLDCCRLRWPADTRARILSWSQRQAAPVLALQWDQRTGAYSSLTDAEEPILRAEAMALLDAETAEALDLAIQKLLQRSRVLRP